jgi:glucosyl-dolichyl phosphate glucuronosyltransferase
MQTITSSAIICTRNRLNDLVRMLNSLHQQTSQPDELIIIDSGDKKLINDPSFLALFNEKFFAQTQLIYKHTKPGLTHQRNVGISCAQKDIIYFFDDDVVLDKDYLKQMNFAFLKNPQAAGGMGTITNIPNKNIDIYRFLHSFFLLQKDYASGNFTFSGMPTHVYGTSTFKPVQVLGGCCMAYRRNILKKYQFDEKLYGYAYMEDCDLSRRVSYEAPLFYNPAATLQHFNSPISRDAIQENRAMFIHNYSYLFFKNFYSRNRLKIIPYCWSIVGLFAEALLLRNKAYLQGYFQGLKRFYSSKS